MKKLLLILSILIASTASVAVFAAPRVEISAHESALAVKALHGALQLSVSHDFDGTARFMIYSITGQLVKSVDVAAGSEILVDLPAGYYIVKTADWSKRMLVN